MHRACLPPRASIECEISLQNRLFAYLFAAKTKADQVTWSVFKHFKPISLSKGDSNHAHDQNPDRRRLS
jgi:hypothetical protein